MGAAPEGQAVNAADKVIAAQVENTANLVSALDLAECGEDGHQVANLLWKIASYLRARSRQ
jgi:hypothetical protein